MTPTAIVRRRRMGRIARAAGLVVLISAATALSATAPLGGSSSSSAVADPAPRTGQVLAENSGIAGPLITPPAAPTQTTPGAPASAVPIAATANPAITTMSFDEPIQGGLTAHEAQAASKKILDAHENAGVADGASTWTPAMGRTAVARARSWLGLPYSWAGGNASGPTSGVCDTSNGADLDCHIVGFDCSGLSSYAWGSYTALPRIAASQIGAAGFHPSRDELAPGDLVFFAGYLPGGVGHVAVYEGKGMVIEAPQSGGVVRRSSLADLMASDGAYRGAVRPMTTATPALAGSQQPIPHDGGTVTLRGNDLSHVTSVTVGKHTIHTVHASDSAVRFRAPRGSGTATVTVTTSWRATSKPVSVTYAAEKPAAPVTTSPTKPTSGSPTKPGKPSTPPASTSPTKPGKPTTPTSPPSTTPSSGPTSSASTSGDTATNGSTADDSSS